MKIFNMSPGGLLVLMALLWLPSNSGAQGTGQSPGGCTNQDEKDWKRLEMQAASSGEKALDQVIAELMRLNKKCDPATKLGGSIVKTLNIAKAKQAELRESHGEVVDAGNKMEKAKEKATQ